MRTIGDFEWKSKRVLLRVDLNSPIVKGKVELTDRLKAHAGTARELSRKGARVVMLAHQGRPGKSDFMGLRQHAKLLNRFLKVKFVDDVIGDKAVRAISRLKDGEVLLLDNVRFLKEEFHPGRNRMVKVLAPLFDIYVDDAFSVAHRNHTSIVSFPKVLPSCAGRVMEHEINAVRSLKKFKKPSVFVLGGTKPEDELVLLRKLGKKVDKFLLCGVFAQYCMACQGFDFGAQNKYIRGLGYRRDKKVAKLLRKNVVLPVDFAVRKNGKRKDLGKEDFPVDYEIFDIGPKTQEMYRRIIGKAGSIFMKGTPGYSEEKQFSRGTRTVLEAIADSKAYSVVGGGHSAAAIERMRISEKRFSHVSLSGGALVRYIAGEKLPGLEALKHA